MTKFKFRTIQKVNYIQEKKKKDETPKAERRQIFSCCNTKHHNLALENIFHEHFGNKHHHEQETRYIISK